MRQMLDRKDIDVIANATQNYWHGLSTIWACQAGKHVYVEKPLSHYIWEGRQMVNAARKYNRIVQCGTQHRSEIHFARVHPVDSRGQPRHDQVRHGLRQQAPVLLRQTRDAAGDPRERRLRPLVRPGPEGAPSTATDCNTIAASTGTPATASRATRASTRSTWHAGASAKRGSRAASSASAAASSSTTPATCRTAQITYYDFPTAPVLYEVHNLTKARDSKEMPNFRGEGVGVIVECEGGSVSLYRGIAWDKDGKEVKKFTGGGDHFANFIAAVRKATPKGAERRRSRKAMCPPPFATRAISLTARREGLPQADAEPASGGVRLSARVRAIHGTPHGPRNRRRCADRDAGSVARRST